MTCKGGVMSKSFVFCVPGGHGEFIVLPQDPSEREKLMQDTCPSDGMSGSYEYSMALVDVDFS